MPDSIATHVLTSSAVRWGIDTLGAQRLHPTFVMYLYLREQHRAGKLSEASAASEEVTALIKMPGNPTRPSYFPLIDRGKRTGKPLPTFWRAENIAGSWSPGSIQRLQGGGWLGGSGVYSMPDNHATLALEQMLYGTRVSALAMGAFFLRNDGFILSGNPNPADVIAAFRARFDYPAETNAEFNSLYSSDIPDDLGFEWFEAPPEPEQDDVSVEEAGSV
jgi:hypothetical protein